MPPQLYKLDSLWLPSGFVEDTIEPFATLSNEGGQSMPLTPEEKLLNAINGPGEERTFLTIALGTRQAWALSWRGDSAPATVQNASLLQLLENDISEQARRLLSLEPTRLKALGSLDYLRKLTERRQPRGTTSWERVLCRAFGRIRNRCREASWRRNSRSATLHKTCSTRTNVRACTWMVPEVSPNRPRESAAIPVSCGRSV